MVTGRQLWWWALDYLWAGAAWLATPFGPGDPDGYARGTLRPVVAIPGVYENWRFLRPLIGPLHAAGHPVHVLTDLGHNRRPIADGAQLLLGYLAWADLRDVVLVAHSKGGLIGKLAMANDEEGRIAGMVALCTPFGGTRRAHLLPLRSIRPLAPGHSTLAALAGLSAVNARITSVFGPWDPHVPEGHELVGGRNRRVGVPGHFRPLGSREVLGVVAEEVARFAPA